MLCSLSFPTEIGFNLVTKPERTGRSGLRIIRKNTRISVHVARDGGRCVCVCVFRLVACFVVSFWREVKRSEKGSQNFKRVHRRRKREREWMGDTKVETISRLAQWRIENFGPCSFKKSDPFKVGIWNW